MTRRRRGKDEPRPIGDVLHAVYPSAEPEHVRGLRAFGWWSRVVPERVANNARPVRFTRGTLVVHTTTSAWAQELDFAREALLASVRRRLPDVEKLRIVVGPLPEAATRHRAAPPPPPVTPVAQLPEEIARALAGVPDDRLRHEIEAAAAVSLGRRARESATPRRS